MMTSGHAASAAVLAAVSALAGVAASTFLVGPVVALLLYPLRPLLGWLGVTFNDEDDFDSNGLRLINLFLFLSCFLGVSGAVYLGGLLFPDFAPRGLLVPGLAAGLTGGSTAGGVARRLAMPGASGLPAIIAAALVAVLTAPVVAYLWS